MNSANYAGELLDALTSPKRPRWGFSDIDKRTAKSIKKAQHFSLPDGGRIFENQLKGLYGVGRLHLPYPVITISCATRKDLGYSKLLIVCEQHDGDPYNCLSTIIGKPRTTASAADKLSDPLMPRISVNAYDYNSLGEWVPCPAFGFIPVEECITGNSESVKLSISAGSVNEHAHNEYMKISGSIEECLGHAYADAMSNTTVVLELLEALSCSNIEIESTGAPRRSLAKKRTLFETKHLVLKRPAVSSKSSSEVLGRGNSPRAHLRRGHIRRLPKGNIWVNACAVGDVKNGFLHKDYGVTA